MKTNLRWLVLGTTLFALTGCFGSTPLDDFVGQTVKLAPAENNTLVGELEFTEVVYGTAWETRCDYREVCDRHWRSTEISEDALSTVARGGKPPRGGDDGRRGDGRRGDRGGRGGWTPPPVVCHQEPYNCRQVEVMTRNEYPIRSKVTATVKGAVDVQSIGTLALGVETNYRFLKAFEDPTTRPKDYASLFDSLAKTDKNVLQLISEKYILTPGQNFLTLPSNFKRGNAIQLEIDVQQADNAKLGVSVVGNGQELPDLIFSD